MQPIKRYAGTGEIRIETEYPAALVDAARSRFSDGRLSEIDGITVQYPDWWFNLRPSNTEPVVKLVMEADSAETLERRCTELLGVLVAANGTT